VTLAKGARSFHRAGRLRFNFQASSAEFVGD
jgi:hypothetical protein